MPSKGDVIIRWIYLHDASDRVRDTAFRLLKAGLALGAIGVLVILIEPSALLDALAVAQWRWMLGALVLLPVNLALDGLVWRRLLHPIASSVPLPQLTRALLAGFTLGFVTPARTGELVGRALALPAADPWAVSLTVFVQRLVDTMINVAVGTGVLAAALYTGWMSASTGWWLLLIGSGVFALLLAGLLAVPSVAARAVRRLLPDRPALHQRVAVLDAYERSAMLRTAGWAGLRYGVFCTQFVLLVYAFPDPPALGWTFAAVALVFLVKFLVPSITLMDLGIREGAAVFFFGLAGVSQPAAFNAALLLFMITLVLPAVAGLPFLGNLRLRRAKAIADRSSP